MVDSHRIRPKNWSRSSDKILDKKDPIKLPVTVAYSGLDKSNSSILQFAEFRDTVDEYGYHLINGTGDPVCFSDSLVELYDWLTLVDPLTGSELPIIIDDVVDEKINVLGFCSVLKVLDKFYKVAHQRRIFESPTVAEVVSGDPEYDWDYDFERGDYVSPSGESPQRKSHSLNFSAVLGVSASQYSKNLASQSL